MRTYNYRIICRRGALFCYYVCIVHYSIIVHATAKTSKKSHSPASSIMAQLCVLSMKEISLEICISLSSLTHLNAFYSIVCVCDIVLQILHVQSLPACSTRKLHVYMAMISLIILYFFCNFL